MPLPAWLERLGVKALARLSVPPARREEVRAAIDRTGRWERHVEWRISTVTSTLIERTADAGSGKFRVRVDCDYVLEARCPTLTRALEIAHVFELMIPRLWETHGWPGWASRTRLEPRNDE